MSARNLTDVSHSATIVHMKRNISVRELRNETASVVSLIESGEQITLTVNRRPVADIVPHVSERDPWVPASELRQIVTESPSDPGLLADIREIRESVIDE